MFEASDPWREVSVMGQNSVLIRRWFDEVWNQGREETVDAMCARDVIGHGQAQHGADLQGPEHFKQFLRSFRSGFSNIHVEIHDTIEQDDKVMARWTATLTHSGTFLGIPSSGKQVRVNGMSVQRIVGSKIVEGWDNWDQLSLLVQLGAVLPAKFL
jgi:steroid delta-isomerase-like uncharacterized protein